MRSFRTVVLLLLTMAAALSQDKSLESGKAPQSETYRNPVISGFHPDPSVCRVGGFLRLQGNRYFLSDIAAPAFVGRKQQHFNCRATTLLEFNPSGENEEAGLAAYLNDKHHYEIAVTRKEGRRCVIVRKTIGDLTAEVEREYVGEGSLQLQIEATAKEYSFRFAAGKRPFTSPFVFPSPNKKAEWKKHQIHSGFATLTAVAADFSSDGRPDIISNSDGKTRLFVAPDWKEIILDADPERGCIHSEVMDVDDDGDLDWIGARYQPGLIFWLEQPKDPLSEPWEYHLVDDQIDGIHGLLSGDVDGDGKPDLLATSAQPKGPYPDSLVWLRVPPDPRTAPGWERYVFAAGDAPGLSHYLGFGDVNGDGRPDAASAAKGGPSDSTGLGNWFAWWEAPQDPKQPWTKHRLGGDEPGATNIHPADVNGDGQTDFIASRGHAKGVIWFEAPNWKTHEIDPAIQEPHSLTVADIDGDGDVDAATCAFGSRVAAWYENDGSGQFETHVLDENQEAYDIRAVDVDADGDLDLLIAGRGSKNVVWYENPLK